MRIVHVVEPFSSGIITFIINLTIALPAHEHLVIHGTRTTEDEMMSVRARFPEYVRFMVWTHADRELNLKRDLKSAITLYKLLKPLKFDVLHLHSAKAGTIGKFTAACLGRGRRSIYTPNGAPFLRRDIGEPKRALFRGIEFVSNRWIGRLVSCGPSEYEAYTGIGLKNIYINNGVALNEPPLRELKFPIVVGCSGILTAQKDPDSFFEIAGAFREDNRVNFVWIGDGSQRNSPNMSAVRITGWMDKDAAAREIADIDIYLSTARWEGLPFAVLESMTRGACLLLRNSPGNRDLVAPGKNGYLFDSVDEAVDRLNHLLMDTARIQEFGRNSRTRCVSYYSLDEMGRQYEEVYREIGA